MKAREPQPSITRPANTKPRTDGSGVDDDTVADPKLEVKTLGDGLWLSISISKIEFVPKGSEVG